MSEDSKKTITIDVLADASKFRAELKKVASDSNKFDKGMEIWKEHPFHKGYLFSSLGNCKCLWVPRKKNKILAPEPVPLNVRVRKNLAGYLRADVSIRGQGTTPLATLILETFRGSRPSSNYDACHNNGNSLDNKLSNLRWGTKKSNSEDRLIHGTDDRGEKSSLSKLTDSQVAEIRECLENKEKPKTLASRYGVSTSLIHLIKKGKHRHQGGCKIFSTWLDSHQIWSILSVLHFTDLSASEIAKMLNTTVGTIENIKYKRRHSSISNKFFSEINKSILNV